MLETYFIQLGVLSTVIILTAIYVYFRKSFLYWKKRGVPILKPQTPFRDLGYALLTKKSITETINGFYKDSDGHRFGGLYKFSVPLLLLRDPELIKDVLVKDFDKFHSRGIKINEDEETLRSHLFNLSGSRWRNLRVKLTPTFTSGKIKLMFGAMVQCGKELQTCLQKPADNGETIEMKDILARYTTDIIASCAFGIQCNCLKNPNAEFRNWGRRIFESSFKARLFRNLITLLPSLSRYFKLSTLSKEVSDYFMKMVKENVEYREKNDVKRNDFMQLMIELKNKRLAIAEEDDLKDGNLETDYQKRNTPFGKFY